MQQVVNLLCYALFAYGLSNILVYAEGPFNIVEYFRAFMRRYVSPIGKMFECMMCTSANVGWVSSLLMWAMYPESTVTFGSVIFGEDLMPRVVFDLFATSGVVWLIHTWQESIEKDGN